MMRNFYKTTEPLLYSMQVEIAAAGQALRMWKGLRNFASPGKRLNLHTAIEKRVI